MNKGTIYRFLKKHSIGVGCLIILVFMLPYIIFGDDSFIIIHDNLDSAISRIKIVFDNHALFNYDATLPIMYGMPRSSFPGPYSIQMLCYAILPDYWAYVTNAILIKLTAFVGMFLLLKYYVLSGERNVIVSLIVSVAFAMIPFYTDYGISSAGIPLVVYSFLNLEKKDKLLLSYFIIVYYVFYSSLVLSGVFLCGLLLLYLIYLLINKTQGIKHYVFGFIALCIIYLFINWRLFTSFFLSSDYISHRVEFLEYSTFATAVYSALGVVTKSQYHAGEFNALIIIIAFGVSLFLRRDKKSISVLIIGAIVVLGIFFGNIAPVVFPSIGLLSQFQFDRFYFLFPAVCFVMLAIFADATFKQKNVIWKVISILFIGFVLLTNISKDSELRHFADNKILQKPLKEPTYRQFFDERLFNGIAQSLEINNTKSSTKVVALGFYPAILEYNGFHALDAYKADYRLDYKHKFRRVIESELAKDESLRTYFDDWGSRCYVFSSELGRNFLYGKTDDKHVRELSINTDELKNLGCKYVFSSVTIDNYEELNLNFINSYTNDDSYWKINVYELK